MIADPRRRIATVYRSRTDIRVLDSGDRLDVDEVVSGFAPQVADLFA